MTSSPTTQFDKHILDNPTALAKYLWTSLESTNTNNLYSFTHLKHTYITRSVMREPDLIIVSARPKFMECKMTFESGFMQKEAI